MQKTTLGPYVAYHYPNVRDPVTSTVTDPGFVAVDIPASKPDKFGDVYCHTVIVEFSGHYECSCPSYQYKSLANPPTARHPHPNISCKHIDIVRSIVETK